jgi:hypothetical protein
MVLNKPLTSDKYLTISPPERRGGARHSAKQAARERYKVLNKVLTSAKNMTTSSPERCCEAWHSAKQAA